MKKNKAIKTRQTRRVRCVGLTVLHSQEALARMRAFVREHPAVIIEGPLEVELKSEFFYG